MHYIIKSLQARHKNMEVKKSGRKPINLEQFLRIKKAGSKKIIVLKRDWKLATPPGAWILRKYLKAEYTVQSLLDNTGWVIKKK